PQLHLLVPRAARRQLRAEGGISVETEQRTRTSRLLIARASPETRETTPVRLAVPILLVSRARSQWRWAGKCGALRESILLPFYSSLLSPTLSPTLHLSKFLLH
ncbi:hypothetical protein EVAR_98514_1, partial [Eumeta japonica]